jgi:hypothetical protein
MNIFILIFIHIFILMIILMIMSYFLPAILNSFEVYMKFIIYDTFLIFIDRTHGPGIIIKIGYIKNNRLKF